MSKPKAPGESASQKRARLAEEERIRIAQARADAEEAAAGRTFLTRRTRAVMRLFGARRAMAGIGGGTPALGGVVSPIAPITSGGGFFVGGGGSISLGGGSDGGGGGGGGRQYQSRAY